MSLEENFETYLKEKYANKEKEQNTETDNPKSLFVETNNRIWHVSIINGHSACLKSSPCLWTQRYNKYLTNINLVFLVRTVSYGSSFFFRGKNLVRGI